MFDGVTRDQLGTFIAAAELSFSSMQRCNSCAAVAVASVDGAAVDQLIAP
jgi:hypothetical protein